MLFRTQIHCFEANRNTDIHFVVPEMFPLPYITYVSYQKVYQEEVIHLKEIYFIYNYCGFLCEGDFLSLESRLRFL